MVIALIVALIALPLAGCGGSSTFVPPPEEAPEDSIPNVDPTTAALILAAWQGSAHSDYDARAFRHWDEDGAIPISCARCHSAYGYQDYLGDDGSPQFSVDQAAELGTTVNCEACHSPSAPELDQVIFPSGYIATGLGAEARCMTCHQGRESTVSLNLHIAAAAVVDDDTSDPDLRFRNIHYFAAGATLYGGAVKGAYQYTLAGTDGVIGTVDDEEQYGFYDQRNPHVASYDTCIECHDPHSLQVDVSACADCHAGVTSVADLRNIRMAGSVRDYDADGNATEGVYYEIDTLKTLLYAAIQQYATNVLGAPIIYADNYPYYFNDTDGDGTVDPGENIFPNSYGSWSARLLRAAYNYQYAKKDPGAYAHNPKYVIEFLYDSLKNLDEHPQVTVPNMGAMFRNDSGHFDAGAYAFRRWDRVADDTSGGAIDRGDVSPSCARCHTPGGIDFFTEYGIDVPVNQSVGDGLGCEQCHVADADYTSTPAVKYIPEFEFPSGVVVENDPGNVDNSFICLACHSGREAGPTIESAISTWIGNGSVMTPPAMSGDPDLRLSFKNVHYYPAGATIYGGDAEGGVQYAGKLYSAQYEHFAPGSGGGRCTFCHLEDHTFEAQAVSSCQACHTAIPLEEYRLGRLADYDGNPATTTLQAELDTFEGRLLQAIQDYATGVIGQGIQYDAHSYPYFFNAPGPVAYPFAYKMFDGPLLRAAHNFQFSQKDPGAWAHHSDYMMQLLYDSIEDLEALIPTASPGDYTGGLVRPAP
ncbi:MAG: hypothetical protein QNJ90_15360 [Planctomycetota bacterium]|nr:hypothetical protein [Planctomycetota bacterium]